MKKVYRFFGGLVKSQENWLNKMSDKGYRLVRTTKASYEFEDCEPGQYQYRVEFIGQKSKESSEDYAHFLEDCGYKVFFKNINLDYSIGKVEGRPWAEKGGRIATKGTTLYKELLIVEKENDGKEFQLHTTVEDRKLCCLGFMKPWIFLLIVCAAAWLFTKQPVWIVFAAISLVLLIPYIIEFLKLKREGRVRE